MSFPRRIFPSWVLAAYHTRSIKSLCAELKCDYPSLRRWLIENNIPLRQQGARINRSKP